MSTPSPQDAPGFTELDLPTLLDRAVRAASRTLGRRARFRLTEQKVPAVRGRGDDLERAVTALLTDAVGAFSATAEQRVGIHLQLSTAPDGDALLSVRDTAAGDRRALVGAFAEPRVSGGDVSLGDACDVFKAHRARVTIAIEPGLATTVSVAFSPAPRAPGLPLPIGAAEAASDVPAESADSPVPAATVLIVDDDCQVRESLCWLLAPLPTCAVASIQEAREVLERVPVSAVLCDLQMPTGLGTELLAWVSVHRPDLERRFALLTGGALGNAARDAVSRSAVPLLEKPFTRDRLLTLLQALSRGDAASAPT